MLTPGLAGALTMMISNALFHAFNLNAAYTALALSFLLGTIVWAATAALLARCIYYVFNSLIIFSVAFGTNSFGLATKVSFNFTSAAYAQASTANASPADIQTKLNALVQSAAQHGADSPAVIAQKNSLSALIDSKAKATPKKAPAPPARFFHSWHF